MKTRGSPGIQLLTWLVFVLLLGGVFPSARAAGIVPQTITWNEPILYPLLINYPMPIGASASSGLPVSITLVKGTGKIEDGMLTIMEPGPIELKAEQSGDEKYASATVPLYSLVPILDMRRVSVRAAPSAHGVDIEGNYAFLVGDSGGLQIFDISNAAHPVLTGQFKAAGPSLAVEAEGHLAFVAKGNSGLLIVNIANPAQPAFVGEFRTGGRVQALQIANNRAYLADGLLGLVIVDVSDPAHPVQLGNVSLNSSPIDLRVAGPCAFVAAGSEGLAIIDISDPARPSRVAAYDTGGAANGVAVQGNLVLVTDFESGLHILDVTEPAQPVLAGREDGSCHYQDVDVQGSYAYVSRGDCSIGVLDISDPTRPKGVGYYGRIEAAALRVSGNRCFALGFPSGAPFSETVLEILELRFGWPQAIAWTGTTNGSLPLNSPIPLSATSSSGLPVTLRVHGPAVLQEGNLTITGPGTVAVTAEQPGDAAFRPAETVARHFNMRRALLTPIDEPLAPDAPRPGLAPKSVTRGNYYFTATGESGMKIYDMSNPTAHVLVGTYDRSGGDFADTLGRAYAVDVVGDFAYLADGQAGLQIIDIRNPAKPVRVGRAPVGNFAISVRVAGNYAFVGSGTVSEIHVVDVSNPAAPAIVGAHGLSKYPQGMEIVGDHLYVTVTASATYGTSFSSSETQVFKLDFGLPQSIAWAGPANVALALHKAYGVDAAASSGLPVEFQVQSGPAVLSNGWITVTGSGTVTLIAAQAGDGDYLPIRVMRHFNLSQATVTFASLHDTPGSASDIHVAGTVAYLADGSSLQIFDVSDPARPVRLSEFTTGSYSRSVSVAGRYAYVADSSTGLNIVDVQDPARPVLAGRLATGTSAVDVAIAGHYAFLANGMRGLVVVDIADPSAPKFLASLTAGSFASAIRIMGHLAFVTSQSAGLHIYDITDPAKPVRVGRSNSPGNADALDVSGTYAYLAESRAPEVIDIANPAAPVRLGDYNNDWQGYMPRDVQVVGTHAFVATDGMGYAGTELTVGAGLRVFDISDPAHLIEVGRYESGTRTEGVQVVGDYVYLAAGLGGLHIVKVGFREPQALEMTLSREMALQKKPVRSPGESTSGLPVTFSIVDGPATLEHGQLRFTGPGQVKLRAEQPGNAQYLPARVEWTVTITPPRLGLRRNGGKSELHWPAELDGYKLQRSDSLVPGSQWRDVPNAPSDADGESQLLLDEAAPRAFFRLSKP